MRKPNRKTAPTASAKSKRDGVEPERVTDSVPAAPFPIVGIGASAGGVEAVTQLVRALPTDTDMGFVLVQHLDPTHPSMLTEILGRVTPMRVSEIADGAVVEPNHVYVIPPASNVVLGGGKLHLSPRKEARGAYHPIDYFFRSLARAQGPNAIGVVLSGGASDGTLGCAEIKAEGGITFAQNSTAQQESMPRSAIASGAVDFVLPPNEIAKEIGRISRHPLARPGVEPTIDTPDSSLNQVLAVLRNVSGVDFSNYKRKTLVRRITRRLVLHKLGSVNDYATMLQSSPAEIEALYQDVLINVTSFFRNPDSFELLKTKVFPELTSERLPHQPVRFWLLGCSTGEEAYSIAIAFAEFSEAVGRHYPVQIFATDLNGVGIEKARVGIYSKDIAIDVSPERLRRYFVEVDGHFRVSKAIRDLCVFAKHNALTDPPFSRMDLISCRNLLIYLEPVLQGRLLPILHYGLNPGGYLWLGHSETIGSHTDLFETKDSKHRLYMRKPGNPRVTVPVPLEMQAAHVSAGTLKPAVHHDRATLLDSQREVDRLLLSRYAPAGVLVTGDFEIVQFRGDTGSYLAPAPGRASLNLLKMLREGLLVGVRGALHKAKREGMPAREEGLRVKSNGGFKRVNLEVVPIKTDSGEISFLVLFEDPAAVGKAPRISTSRRVEERDTAGKEKEIVRLEQELSATREYLQAVIEEQEAANEELQSANEEVQSANEELQSTNEELETSKEETQSTNEELTTVNDELQTRNAELSRSNNDLLNLVSSVQMAIVMLGLDLRIRRFTPTAEKLLNLLPSDIGRSISEIKSGIDVEDLESLLTEVIDSVSVTEREVQARSGRWYSLRLRPYRTLENRIEGVVMMLVDIDVFKRNMQTLARQANMMHQALEPIFAWDFDGRITYWNRAAEETYGFSGDEALGKNVQELVSSSARVEELRRALLSEGKWTGELAHRKRNGEEIIVETRMVLVREGDEAFVLEATRPISERKRLEQELRDRASALAAADQRKNEFLAILAHELRNPLAPLNNAVHLVREPAAGSDVKEEALHMIDRQLRRLTQLVDDLLDVSRVEHGKIVLRLQPMEIRAFLMSVADDARPMLDARGQKLELSLPRLPLYVSADPTRLAQVFGNLLSNASKYSGPETTIHLTAESTSPAESLPQVLVRVIDQGIGIDGDYLPRIFDLFTQENQVITRATGGLGIGLALAKTLTHLHGGHIEARSGGRGTGSEFTVRLNLLSHVPREEPAPRRFTPRPARSHRVLIADDNTDAADSLAEILRLSGHEVEVAYKGDAALDAVREFSPSAMILDLAMPNVDGFEIARRVRAGPGGSDILLIALTGYGHDDDRRLTRSAGFDHHVTKPADLDVLRSLLGQGVAAQPAS